MVYVDDMRAGFGRMIMCHMVADTRVELLEMADRIGVDRKWIRKAGTPKEHFDICLSKRAVAIRLGAVGITQRELALRICKSQVRGSGRFPQARLTLLVRYKQKH